LNWPRQRGGEGGEWGARIGDGDVRRFSKENLFKSGADPLCQSGMNSIRLKTAAEVVEFQMRHGEC
jgi:hypothetical protein